VPFVVHCAILLEHGLLYVPDWTFNASSAENRLLEVILELSIPSGSVSLAV
jgi:hypothetical protein